MEYREVGWVNLNKIRRDRDIFDLLTALIAILALIIPFVQRSCERPRITFTSDFVYIVNFETYPNLVEGIISNVRPETKDIKDRLEPTNEHLRHQIKWLYHLRLFKMKFKNERAYPISLDQLKLEDLECSVPLPDMRVVPAYLTEVDNTHHDFVHDPFFNVGSGEIRSFNVIVGFMLVIQHRTPTADSLFQESLSTLIALEDSLRRSSTKAREIADELLLIGGGKRYEYLGQYLQERDGAPFIYRDIYLKYFSRVRFKPLRFSVVDNTGQKHYSNRAILN
ncbi:MAG: hypothetical protein FJ217_09885 [Ignavibacteria bacterium]|nr:hypothetical protein [Ignavibacteria bacterium]